MAREFRTDLELKLQNPEFARAFGAAQAKSQAALALARARRSAGISQKVLAEKSGHSQPYIAKLERGDANPTLATVGALLAIMGQRLTTDVAPLGHRPLRPHRRPGSRRQQPQQMEALNKKH